jgi:hypothetical protein
MRHRIWGTLLWLLLLPLIGAGGLLWRMLCVLTALRPSTVLVLVGLVVALSLRSPVTAQLADAGLWPPGHGISVRLGFAIGIGVLYHGLRSPTQRRLWRRLRHAG